MHNNPILWIMKKTSKRSFEVILKSRDLDVSSSTLPYNKPSPRQGVSLRKCARQRRRTTGPISNEDGNRKR